MSVGMKPTGDRIMVELLPTVDETDSGLYLPEQRRPDNVAGTVVALGDDYDGPLKVGDRVLVSSHGTVLKVNGANVAILPREKVVGKVEE